MQQRPILEAKDLNRMGSFPENVIIKNAEQVLYVKQSNISFKKQDKENIRHSIV